MLFFLKRGCKIKILKLVLLLPWRAHLNATVTLVGTCLCDEVIYKGHHVLMFLNDLECGQFSDLLRELYVGILLQMVEDDIDIDYLVAGLLLVRPFDL